MFGKNRDGWKTFRRGRDANVYDLIYPTNNENSASDREIEE